LSWSQKTPFFNHRTWSNTLPEFVSQRTQSFFSSQKREEMSAMPDTAQISNVSWDI
jgi:hypothetical protein